LLGDQNRSAGGCVSQVAYHCWTSTGFFSGRDFRLHGSGPMQIDEIRGEARLFVV
jgi:hypothetical protein